MKIINVVMKYLQIGLAIFFVIVAALRLDAQIPVLPPDPYFDHIIPAVPDVQKIKTYGNVTINKAKGLPAISIPLYSLEIDGVKIPVELNYNGNGVKVNDVEGIVGMSWNLSSGGMIYRNVKGKPDEKSSMGWFYCQSQLGNLSTWNNSPSSYQTEIYNFFTVGNTNDTQPDEFGYQFGGYSGTFFFDQNKVLRKKSNDPLSFQLQEGVDGSGNNLIYFIVKDEWGNTYYFGSDATSRETSETYVSSPSGAGNSWNDNGVTCWKLTSITTNKGHVVNFTYVPYDDNPSSAGVQKLTYQFLASQEYTVLLGSWATGYTAHIEPVNISNTFSPVLISSIVTDTKRVDFKYLNVTTNSYPYKMKLDSVKITDLVTQTKKGYKLSYFEDVKRYLTSVKEFDSNLSSTSGALYNIDYNVTNPLPEIGSKAQDYFGYYNGKTGNVSLIVSPPDITYADEGNRRVYNAYLQYGIITSIKYPTGGYTYFDWEPNFQLVASTTDTLFAPGLRIKRVYDKDENSKVFNDKRYIYSGLTGYTITQGASESYFIKDYRNSGIESYYSLLSSDIKKNRLNVDDYYYRKIEEYYYDSGVITGRTTERFVSDTLGSAYNNYPTSLKTEKYESSAYSTSKLDSNSYTNSQYSYSPYYILGDTRFKNSNGSRITYFNGLYRKIITLSNPQVSAQTITEYEGSTTYPVVTGNAYTYNSSGLVSTKTHSISYESVKTQYRYPSDINTGVYASMVTANMLNYPAEILSYKNTSVSGSQLNTYKLEDGNYVPYQVFVLETTTPLSSLTLYNGTTKDSHYSTTPEVTYNDYDTRGNLLNQTEKNGKTTSFLWDTYKEYLMAKIEGATYTWSGASCNYDSKTLWTTLNTSYPNSFVTTYSYSPLYGPINQTVQNGVKTTYAYDTFGRLSTITNDDTKYLKKYTYNYANY